MVPSLPERYLAPIPLPAFPASQRGLGSPPLQTLVVGRQLELATITLDISKLRRRLDVVTCTQPLWRRGSHPSRIIAFSPPPQFMASRSAPPKKKVREIRSKFALRVRTTNTKRFATLRRKVGHATDAAAGH